MKINLILLVISTVLSLLGVEIVLRLLHEPPKHPVTASENLVWKQSSELGWEAAANASFLYSNGYFAGKVSTDSHGNRNNSTKSTYQDSYHTLFFIGDSTTASYEVNNDQTIPALVEHTLRKLGHKVNVVNLGVRGYSTGQSVRKALLHAKWYNPVEIIYMYTDNDFFDNNVLQQPFRKFGKGVYLKSKSGSFEEFNYPVPTYSSKYFGAIVLNRDQTPKVFEGEFGIATSDPSRSRSQVWQKRFAKTSYTFSLFATWVNGSNSVDRLKSKLSRWPDRPEDPIRIINDSRGNTYDVYFALFDGLSDGGYLRQIYSDYYNEQFRFLVNKLRSISGVKKVHLVEFPSSTTLELMSSSQNSTNKELFSSLLQDKIVDTYINLNQQMLSSNTKISDFTCKKDAHFCQTGNVWIADRIVDKISF